MLGIDEGLERLEQSEMTFLAADVLCSTWSSYPQNGHVKMRNLHIQPH